MNTAKSLRAILFASLCIVCLVVIALIAMSSTRGAPAAATYLVSATPEPVNSFYPTPAPPTLDPAILTSVPTSRPRLTPIAQTPTSGEAIQLAHDVDPMYVDWKGNEWDTDDTERITVTWTDDANNGNAFNGDGTPAPMPGWLVSITGIARIQSAGPNCSFCLFDGVTYFVSAHRGSATFGGNGPAVTPTTAPTTTPPP